jgi:hypothetical protein
MILLYIFSYLSPFITRSWTVYSMKVLNKIIQKVELPREFINSYIKHCINSYKQETRKDLKTRLARLISIFITNLLENEHLSHDIIPPEVIFFIFKINRLRNYLQKSKRMMMLPDYNRN